MATTTTTSSSPFDLSKENTEYNQYWYSPYTIDILLNEIIKHGRKVAFLSTPSVYFAMLDRFEMLKKEKENKTEEGASERVDTEWDALTVLCKESRLFEFDPQWVSSTDVEEGGEESRKKKGNVVFYDYHHPEQIPISYLNAFDYIVADPPFITKEVWEGYMKTIHFLILKRVPEGLSAASSPSSSSHFENILGKVLLTSVLENHPMLESLYDGPLFIAPFRPSVPHLTYQYVCFTNYYIELNNQYVNENASLTSNEEGGGGGCVSRRPKGGLEQVNTKELKFDEEDRKVLSAIVMSNELKLSEKCFSSQMLYRDREGEEVLPTLQRPRKDPSSSTQEDMKEKDWEKVPLEEMHWSYIPEGLTMYADGPTPSTTEHLPKEEGEVYDTAKELRETLDAVKNKIDVLQRVLDQQLKSRAQRAKAKKEQAEADVVEEWTKKIDQSELQRKEECDAMEKLFHTATALESKLRQLQEAQQAKTPSAAALLPPPSYYSSTEECMQVYRTTEVRRALLMDLAADATRKYKSPLF